MPFAYSSNGDAFLEHDRTRKSGPIEREIPLQKFPSPDELWARYRASKGYTDAQQAVITQDYHDDGSRKSPRDYQLIAINRTVDAIARGEKRILLVMATGTGKTYTAFQIIWRLWKSGAKKRILFLVDRNILADQTKTNDFKPFGPALTKITNRTADKSYEIYLALYQAITGTEESQNIYRQFSPDFFDLAKLSAKGREVVAALIQKYIAVGVSSLESMDILKVDPLPKLGTPIEIVALFGGKAGYLATMSQLKNELYR